MHLMLDASYYNLGPIIKEDLYETKKQKGLLYSIGIRYDF
jgi:hypothetical protein